MTGYTITFLHSDPITIYHGEKGDKGDKGDQGEQGIQGEPGKDGADRTDGSDGKDGYTPQIGLTQQADGNWYWTLDGELMLDPNGDPIRANGTETKAIPVPPDSPEHLPPPRKSSWAVR